MASDQVTYDKRELRSIVSAFKAMDDAAVDGPQRPLLTASAGGFHNGLARLRVLDNQRRHLTRGTLALEDRRIDCPDQTAKRTKQH